ncbi:Memo-like protein [Candidatus Norongarragalina meridionalis]|nr:Memo-like protein [Candidatus Norongarragalina meridionalis]
MREPAVAGSFYPGDSEDVEEMLAAFRERAKAPKKKTDAVVAPHAGWIYSGATAMHSFLALEKKKTYVVLSPNHTGAGAPIAMSAEDWETPLGTVKNDKALAKELGLPISEAAHQREHSVEVQLPFLQFLFGDFSFVPITMMDQSLEAATMVAEKLAASKKDFAVVASSDFTHYEPAKQAKEKDDKVIDAILKMDADLFYQRLQETHATACGFGPIAAAMLWAKKKGRKKGELLAFSNSGDVSGDYAAVVDYAAIAFR